MECTQKNNKKQIGSLTIHDMTYPIYIGHNKIGRDPQLCNVVVNMNDISRQHALINILNEKDFTLTDLRSANKTKLMNYGSENESKGTTETTQTLVPFIPYPLKHAATIEFGTIPALFSLLDADSDFPATQVNNAPPTPVNFAKSKFFHDVAVTIPESPDVSDKDDSFVVPSQPRKQPLLKNNLQFINPSNKLLSIKPVGSNKIDNIYWELSKKSKSFTPNSSLNVSDSLPTENRDDIFEMETQPFFCEQNIHTAETQIPQNNSNLSTSTLPAPESDDNIHEMETQAPIPQCNQPTASIQACHTNALQASIHNLDTQITIPKKIELMNQLETQLDLHLSNKENNDDIFNAETQLVDHHKEPSLTEKDFNKNSKLSNAISKIDDDDDLTDCEDIDIVLTQQQLLSKSCDLLHCTDVDKLKSVSINNDIVIENIEDLATQVLECNETSVTNNEPAFEDMLTQVLCEDIPKVTEDPSVDIHQYSEDMISRFKKNPLQSTNKSKKKDTTKIIEEISNDYQYYTFTQDIYNDLCSQKQLSPKKDNTLNKSKDDVLNRDIEIAKDLEKNYVVADKNPGIEAKMLSPKSINSSGDEAVNAFVSSLSKQEVCNVIGVQMAPIKQLPSDASDVDVTPKKSKPFKLFSDSEMPSTQDIIDCVSSVMKNKTETSSESETDCSEDQNTPVLFRPKKKPKLDAKKDLVKSFAIDALPSRVMMRNRKATSNLLGGCEEGVDTQIIQENITRLKNNSKKRKEQEEIKKDVKKNKSKEDNKDMTTTNIKKRKENTSDKKSKQNDTHIAKVNQKTSKSSDTINTSKRNTKTIGVTQHSKHNKRDERSEAKSNSNVASVTTRSATSNKDQKKTLDNTEYRKVKKDKKITEKNNSDVASGSKNRILICSNNKSHNNSKQKKLDGNIEMKSNLDSKSSVKRSTRNTTRKEQEIKQIPKSTTYENIDRKSQDNKTETKRNSPSPHPEKEVRRSIRQRTMKEFQPPKEIKSILKNKDISTMYDVSSVLNGECSNSFKRSIETDCEGPSSKRSRKSISNSTKSLSLRNVTNHCVLFTAFPRVKEVEPKLERLGATVVENVKECTVVITQQLRRTFKVLCAIGLGKPIVGVDWVQACIDAKTFVDPWLYLLKDKNVEKKYCFSLLDSLKGNRNFLHGYNVSATPSVLPPAHEMKEIVECSGGTWKEGGEGWICVSCKADIGMWPAIRRKGATIVTTEVILSGTLQQQLVIAGNEFI